MNFVLTVLLFSLSVNIGPSLQNVFLSPPYFNLAEGKNITATASCGEDKGRPINETYCKTTGANPFTDQEGGPQDVLLWQEGSFIRGGQLCDFCKSDVPEKSHPVQHAIDGTGRWWQSPPLSRGDEYNRINITIDLGQEYHVAYVYLRMATSPRPAIWVLERSVDLGQTWLPWQYFAESDRQCRDLFDTPSEIAPHFDEQVLCVTRFSNLIPLEEGEIVVSLVNDRPSSHEFAFSQQLQEFTKATNIRFRFLRAKTLYGQLMSQAHDASILRRYYYSVKDISIGGRCVCNGHASICNETVPGEPTKLRCRCQHNTCGHQCESCCPGFRNRRWLPATPTSENACEACQCNGHSDSCNFNETLDRPVCFDCRDHTVGMSCENCVSGYYHPPGVSPDDRDSCVRCPCPIYEDSTGVQLSSDRCSDIDGKCECLPAFTGEDCSRCSPDHMGDWPYCVPCYCYIKGSVGAQCDAAEGRCTCREHYSGDKCDMCSEGFFNSTSKGMSPDNEQCITCDCDEGGTQVDSFCDPQTGQCKCIEGFAGIRCDRCDVGYHHYPECMACKCEHYGVNTSICSSSTGECFCKERYTGPACEACETGYYNLGACEPCHCSGAGVSPQYKDICSENGQCYCKQGFSSLACDTCAPGYFAYPECHPCNCSAPGTVSNNALDCDITTGQCRCRSTTTGKLCDECIPNLYNYPECEVCNCDPAGAIQVAGLPPGGCGALTPNDRALCKCKPFVEGRICSRCRQGYWNLNGANPDGCESCACYVAGTLGELSICRNATGQCHCRRWTTSRDCSSCLDGFYHLDGLNPFGCTPCDCDRGGSDFVAPCNKETGQCNCLSGIQGLRCNEPDAGYYFPTLHQHRFEMEDGYQLEGERKHGARYLDDESLLSSYSWKGYAVMSIRQSEVMIDLPIEVTSRSNTTHYVIFSYVNPSDQDVTGTIRFRPSPEYITGEMAAVEQSLPVTFKSSAASTHQMFTDTKGPFELAASATSGGYPVPMTIVLDLKSDLRRSPESTLFVDYAILLPSEYREGVLLRKTVSEPCTFDTDFGSTFCRWYVYPSPPIGAVGSTAPDECARSPIAAGEPKPTFLEPFLHDILPQDLPHATLGTPLRYLVRPPTASGSYIILIDYAAVSKVDQAMSPPELDVSVGSSRSGKTFGFVAFQHCRFFCRQVVKTESRDLPAFFQLSPLPTSDGCVPITLDLRQGGPRAVAIKSVTLVPADLWHISLLRPEPACLVVNGKCSSELYPDPPAGSFIANFATAPTAAAFIEAMTSIPNAPAVVSIGQSTSTPIGLAFYISANITTEGRYSLYVHYFQPQSADMVLKGITINSDRGSSYRQFGTLVLPFCPNNGGCLAEIVFPSENAIQLPAGVVSVDFKTNPNIGPTHLYRLLAIPERKSPPFAVGPTLAVQQLDLSSRFYSHCTSKGYFMDEQKRNDPLCRQLLFTLTTAYNSGGLPCNCEANGLDEAVVGRMGRKCADLGGQCYCKPNVIGRQCSACRPGFYGFPDCQRCDCDRGTCDAETGECICPPNVEGYKCDRCVPGAWGFNRILGCQSCNCDERGVIDGRIDACNAQTGNCTCRENIESRRCDRCRAGFYSFPYCSECDCDKRGTVDSICNGETGQCSCKANIDPTSPRCDACKPNHYHLDTTNPQGCTKCFCSNQARSCGSNEALEWQRFGDMMGWRMTPPAAVEFMPQGEQRIRTFFYPPSVSHVDFLLRPDSIDSTTHYFVAPASYLGNKVASFGGSLRWTISVAPEPLGSSSNGVLAPDLILIGGRAQPPLVVGYSFSENYFASSNGRPVEVSVVMTERSFHRVGTSGLLTSDDFKELLISVKAILIRASYSPQPQEATLKSVWLEIGVESQTGQADVPNQALSVEICNCPAGYSGTSCEQCAEGYTRKGLVAGGFECAPCDCGGRSEKCDRETGECLACADNFGGSRCESCLTGHYYDSKTDTCRLCECPGNTVESSYASNCTVDNRGRVVLCDCIAGFSGTHCQTCAPGHFGDPGSGRICKPCICNSNIDMTDPNACDRQTGVCESCLYNTAGDSCAQCREWFHGSATKRRCIPCNCDQCGASSCDGITGMCQCQPNVTSTRCDTCLPNYFGFRTCQGCSPCNCDAASKSATCEPISGQCPCVSSSVTGRRCEECADGYWQYTAEGCQMCECGRDGSFTCDKSTGRCICKEGYVGPRCEECAPGWLRIEGLGCQACDECVRQLAEDVVEEAKNATESYSSLQQLSASVEARNRLADLKTRLAKVTETLTPSTPQEIARHANEQTIELTKSLERIKSYLAEFKRRMVEIKANGEKFNKSAEAISAKFDNLTQAVTALEEDLNDLLSLTERYIKSLQDPVQFNWREMLDVAQRKLEDMERALNQSKLEVEAWEAELDATMILHDKVSEFYQNFTATQSRLDEIKLKLNTTLPKQLSELDDGVSQILKTTEDLRRNLSSGEAELRTTKEKIAKIREQEEAALQHLTDYERDSRALNESLEQCETKHGPSRFTDMARQCTRLEREMAEFVANWQLEIEKYNETIVPRQKKRVQELEDRVRAIEQQIFNPSESQRQAIDVATRYDKIAEKLTAAYAIIDETVAMVDQLARDADRADQVDEMRDRASQIDSKTDRLERDIDSLSRDLSNIGGKLDQEKERVDEVQAKIDQTGTILGMVKDRDLVIGLDDLAQRNEKFSDSFDSIIARAKLKDMDATKVLANLQGKDPEAERNFRQAAIDTASATETLDQVNNNWKNLKAVEMELNAINAELGEMTENLWSLIGRSKEATAQLSDIRPSMSMLNSSTDSAEIALDHETVAAMGVELAVDLQHLPCQMGDATNPDEKSLILFLGPNFAGLSSNSSSEADYLALELSRPGEAKFKYWATLNLGRNSRIEGSVEFPHTLPPSRCSSPALMHRISIRRSAQQLNLTVGYRNSGRYKEEMAPGTFTAYLPDTNFFFRPKMPRLFVGGLPDDFVGPPEISRTASTGLYQHLNLHSTKPTALFNLANFTNMQLANGMSRTDDYNVALLSGDLSYISLPFAANKISRTEFQVISFALEFSTLQPDALLAYMASDDKNDFVSLDLRDGALRLQFDMYKHVLAIHENCGGKKFNDGVLHRVLVEVSNRMSSLYAVDCPDIQRAEYPQQGDAAPHSLNVDTLYLGGVHETIAEKLIRRVYHNENRQVEPKLVGCIGKVSLLAPQEDREDFWETLDAEEFITFRPFNQRSYGAKFGYETCPSGDTESWLVSFTGRPTSFYHFQAANVERIAFMLKTVKPGLVFFMRNEQGWSLECSVIEDQKLTKVVVVYRNGAEESVKLAAPISKVMGEWISILVALNTKDKSLLLNVEDRHTWKETGDNIKNLLPNDGNVLLEGLVDVFLGGAGTYSEGVDFGQSLDGCVGRLFINNKAEWFQQIPGTQYRLGHCSVQSQRLKHTPCQLDQKAGIPDIRQLPENFYCYTFGKPGANVRFFGKPKLTERFTVSVKLRTVHLSGLLFYVHGNVSRSQDGSRHIMPDYMMAYLLDGRIVFKFDPGSGVLEVSSNRSMARYNDGRLHKLIFFSDGVSYGFAGDLDAPVTKQFPQSYKNRKLDGIVWQFLGGFSSEFKDMFARAEIEQRGYERMDPGGRQTLIGTLSDFTLDGKLFEQPEPFATNPCYDSLEHGVYFADLIERPSTASLSRSVELDPYKFTLTLMIRARTTRALIAYIHDLSNPSNSLSVFLSAGRLYAQPGSGSPRLAVNVPITNPCSGDWIRIVVGSRPDSIKIAADHQRQTLRLYRTRRARNTSRGMRLYIGGLPERLRESRFTPVTDSFVGCIDAIYLDGPQSGKYLPLHSFDRNGENGTIAHVDYCPLY